MALEAGLTEAEGEIVTGLFLQATNDEEWLNADALKEMMRCAFPSFLLALVCALHAGYVQMAPYAGGVSVAT